MLKGFPGLLIAACVAVASQAQSGSPRVKGYVTSVEATGFAVDGDHVLITPQTKLMVIDGDKKLPVDTLPRLTLGESVEVWGKFVDKKSNDVTAAFLHVNLPGELPLKGTGMILAREPGGAADEGIFFADGYRLRISPKTKLTDDSQIKALADITTNCWIGYSGMQGADGVVDVREALVFRNTVDEQEQEALARREYKPEEVGPADKQSGLSKALLGVKMRKLPSYPDAAAQARVKRIGESLIPQYQRDLPETDRTRLHFRFEVVDTAAVRDNITSPNGIVLVPYAVVARLENDSQLAAVVADGIAEAIEKQEFVDAAARKALTVAGLAGDVATFFAWPALLVSPVVGHGQDLVALREAQQGGRISLGLMRAAGYDLAQAPIAWWLLASKVPKPLDQVPVPERANHLYLQLGTTWRTALQ